MPLPEKRKVGSSTLPLTTISDQRKRPDVPGLLRHLTATVTATASSERFPQLPQRLALLVQRHVRVDRHRDLDCRVTDDLPHYVRRGTEVQEQRHAGTPEIVKAHDPSPARSQVSPQLRRRLSGSMGAPR